MRLKKITKKIGKEISKEKKKESKQSKFGSRLTRFGNYLELGEIDNIIINKVTREKRSTIKKKEKENVI